MELYIDELTNFVLIERKELNEFLLALFRRGLKSKNYQVGRSVILIKKYWNCLDKTTKKQIKGDLKAWLAFCENNTQHNTQHYFISFQKLNQWVTEND
ncbi:hypothetical protein HYE54_03545 [Aggregatibacter actinomycetemcomitans]|uniref:hypothetical protein n=1 Tax=Aggregatibacter actinomycetemcomitans TaxID=714 RepID=UPI00197BE5BE|nr:hypothetical protein [Aggregatibacter actinomycetemcomitans]MBN6067859.1 hypothetical protein [Aggregatibacter actinomycetemcomitans]MBN6085796.1 hypothetical protein [Aggregatibacter actinomycetemcomitans]